MKKMLVLLLSSIGCTVAIAGASLQKLTVMLDWFPNADHAPLIVAKEQGYFKKQGLDVEFIAPSDPSDPSKLVAAGKIDLGITYQPAFMEQVDQGLPLIRVGTLIDKPLDCIVVLKDSGIKSIADLKGKKIGTGSSGLSSVMLLTVLKNAGLSEKDVTLIHVKYNLTQALLSHRVDAVTGLMRNVEVPQLEAQGQKITAFFPEDNGIPNYSVLIFITNTKHAKDPRIPRFLAAVKEGVEYLDLYPQQGFQQFVKAYPEANNAINQKAWFATLPYFSEDPADYYADDWKKFADFMKKNQMIKTIQPTSRYAVVLR